MDMVKSTARNKHIEPGHGQGQGHGRTPIRGRQRHHVVWMLDSDLVPDSAHRQQAGGRKARCNGRHLGPRRVAEGEDGETRDVALVVMVVMAYGCLVGGWPRTRHGMSMTGASCKCLRPHLPACFSGMCSWGFYGSSRATNGGHQGKSGHGRVGVRPLGPGGTPET